MKNNIMIWSQSAFVKKWGCCAGSDARKSIWGSEAASQGNKGSG